MYQNLIPEMKDAGFKGEIFSSLSSREIGQKLKMFLQEHMEKKFIILFKGSQNTIFTEEALAIFLTKQEQAKIPRQSLSWKEKKEDFFKRV